MHGSNENKDTTESYRPKLVSTYHSKTSQVQLNLANEQQAIRLTNDKG